MLSLAAVFVVHCWRRRAQTDRVRRGRRTSDFLPIVSWKSSAIFLPQQWKIPICTGQEQSAKNLMKAFNRMFPQSRHKAVTVCWTKCAWKSTTLCHKRACDPQWSEKSFCAKRHWCDLDLFGYDLTAVILQAPYPQEISAEIISLKKALEKETSNSADLSNSRMVQQVAHGSHLQVSERSNYKKKRTLYSLSSIQFKFKPSGCVSPRLLLSCPTLFLH